MKHATNPFVPLMLVLCITLSTALKAQPESSVRYRVVAVQHDNPEITSTSNEVVAMMPAQLYVPNAFTPNGDGLNDTFGAVGEALEGFQMNIYNRQGEMVFASNDIRNKWDGSVNGQPAPMGVYVYKILAWDEQAERLTRHGTVTLVP
ncbi:MAG: gliding motility-associated C-terminal domain-containing protein [Bacteroidota bacterium]